MNYSPLDVARFWSKVRIPSSAHHMNLCWPWRGSPAKGYGQIKIDGTPLRAHRVSYELIWGGLPDGMLACHKCDNRKCCNPHHIYAGSSSDNAKDAATRNRAAVVTAYIKTRNGYKRTRVSKKCAESAIHFSVDGKPVFKSLKEIRNLAA